MKLLLSIMCIAIACSATAQQPTIKINKLPDPGIRKQMDSLLTLYKTKHPEKFILPVNPKPGIHVLPGGMPCIVPEPPTAGLIPNLWNGNIFLPFKPEFQPIPNPALPRSKESNPNVTKQP